MSVLSLAWVGVMGGTVAGYWLLSRDAARLWLIAATALFLVYVSPASAALLSAFTLVTYYLTRSERGIGPKALAVGAVLLGVLATFKIRAAADGDPLLGLLIPLGLSYYALRCIHYVVERYKGALPPHDFVDFVGYLFFLPTIVAGPIHRFGEFHRDARRLRWDSEKFAEGLERILYGYVKITFLANHLVSVRLGRLIEALPPEQSTLAAYLQMLQGGLNGYLQFSGYSDVAIGFALLLGYRVMENFRWPLLQRNIAEFWKCWHISLSSWCRDYVYMLVVSFTRRPAIAILAAMLAIGLWHEASTRYLAWGVYNGLGIIAWQQFQRAKPWLRPRLPVGLRAETPAARLAARGLAVLVTFHFVMLGFVIVLQPTLADAWAFYRTLLGGL